MNQVQTQKYERLRTILYEMGGVVVAYSGGVDSTLLAKTAHDVLGDRAVMVTAVSESLPHEELEECRRLAAQLGFNFRMVQTRELDQPKFRENSPLRCAFCKGELMDHLREIADREGIQTVVLGTNVDDLGDYRPGQTAALEKGARFPLVEAGMTKEDIRAVSLALGLPTWDKPSFACLASRFPYGEEITADKLYQVARSEKVLKDAGLRQYRVRYHREVARIEVTPDDMPRVLEMREQIASQLRALGFTYVTMDLMGFRSGSMNEALTQAPGRVDIPKTDELSQIDRPPSIEPSETYVLYCDGGSRGNPGPGAYAALIEDQNGRCIATLAKFLGSTTNNAAEYEGLLAGLLRARELGIRNILIKMDSELVVRQINGTYRVKHPGLKPLYEKCRAVLHDMDRWQISHITREENRQADQLVNKTLDEHCPSADQETPIEPRKPAGNRARHPQPPR